MVDTATKIQSSDEALAYNGSSISTVERRIIVVGIVRNDLGQYLICKMPEGRGSFS